MNAVLSTRFTVPPKPAAIFEGDFADKLERYAEEVIAPIRERLG